jgi:hypothetical protein
MSCSAATSLYPGRGRRSDDEDARPNTFGVQVYCSVGRLGKVETASLGRQGRVTPAPGSSMRCCSAFAACATRIF